MLRQGQLAHQKDSRTLRSYAGRPRQRLAPAPPCRAQPPSQPAPPPALDRRLLGTWVKDRSRSTPMDGVADLVALNGIVRQGVSLLRGLELGLEARGGGALTMGVFSAIPLVKITERYPLDGSEAPNMRRDLRPGSCRGSLALTPAGLPVLALRWPEPYGGAGRDEFVLLPERGELHVISHVTVNGRTVSYTSVHTRG